MLDLVDIPAGLIFLRDDRTGRRWHIDLPPFRLARYPVTRPDGLPRTDISWYESVALCNQLSKDAGLSPAYTIDGENVHWDTTSTGYRLPTEAEWQHACTAGTPAYRYGPLDDIAWHATKPRTRPHQPPLGLPHQLQGYPHKSPGGNPPPHQITGSCVVCVGVSGRARHDGRAITPARRRTAGPPVRIGSSTVRTRIAPRGRAPGNPFDLPAVGIYVLSPRRHPRRPRCCPPPPAPATGPFCRPHPVYPPAGALWEATAYPSAAVMHGGFSKPRGGQAHHHPGQWLSYRGVPAGCTAWRRCRARCGAGVSGAPTAAGGSASGRHFSGTMRKFPSEVPPNRTRKYGRRAR
ncbi:formylglycine-generating enzyme family protein [Kribbella solani]|uniref:formylglycine-generating enzyme family protein n=1 Tax=Kribbella solani TaxID=236067 RepID=UPI0038D45AFE